MNKYKNFLKENLSITNIDDWENCNNWKHIHPNGLIESFLIYATGANHYTYREQHPFKEGIVLKFYDYSLSKFYKEL